MSSLFLSSDISAPAPDLHVALVAGAHQAPLVDLVMAILNGALPIGTRLAQSDLPGDPSAVLGQNDSGDAQKVLDKAAHDHMIATLSGQSVRSVLSEEAVDPIALSKDGRFDVAVDPIDGSGSIGLGAPLGLLFAIFEAGPSFLRSGREIIAAGYVCFGHSIDCGVSLGSGVHLATLVPQTGTFKARAMTPRINERAKVFAYNASNLSYWPNHLRAFLDYRIGSDPAKPGINMRWPAAAVADLHRILIKGGLFLYPSDSRPGYENGRLRLIYEAFPIAFLIENAGGRAIDGVKAILDKTAQSNHEHTPLLFGAASEIATIQQRATQDSQGV